MANQPWTWLSHNRRLILWLATTLIVGWVLWTSRGALTPFFVGLAIAYLIAPVVAKVESDMPEPLVRTGRARPVAVVIVYLVFILVVVTLLAALIPPLLNEVAELIENLPDSYEQVRAMVVEAVHTYDNWLLRITGSGDLPDEAQDAINELVASRNVERLVDTAVNAAQAAIMATVGVVQNTVSWVLAFLVVPFWLVYVLNDTGRMLDGGLGLIPRSFRADVEAIRLIVDRVLSAYIRGQLIIAVILGAMATLALTLLGVPYALLIGVVSGFLGLIPLLGAILGALIGVLVALLQDPGLAVRTLLAFIAIQQIDNILVTPRVQGESVALHPALIMVVVVLGQNIFGPIGLLISVPITAILRDVLHFLYLRVGDEPLSVVDALTEVGYAPLVEQMRVSPAGARL